MKEALKKIAVALCCIFAIAIIAFSFIGVFFAFNLGSIKEIVSSLIASISIILAIVSIAYAYIANRKTTGTLFAMQQIIGESKETLGKVQELLDLTKEQNERLAGLAKETLISMNTGDGNMENLNEEYSETVDSSYEPVTVD